MRWEALLFLITPGCQTSRVCGCHAASPRQVSHPNLAELQLQTKLLIYRRDSCATCKSSKVRFTFLQTVNIDDEALLFDQWWSFDWLIWKLFQTGSHWVRSFPACTMNHQYFSIMKHARTPVNVCPVHIPSFCLPYFRTEQIHICKHWTFTDDCNNIICCYGMCLRVQKHCFGFKRFRFAPEQRKHLIGSLRFSVLFFSNLQFVQVCVFILIKPVF